MTEKNILVLDKLNAGYKNKNIIKDLSVELEAGCVAALLGLNGCGKTTLLKAICGLIPSKGICLVNGEDPRKPGDKKRAALISYIAQRASIAFPISVLDVTLMGFNHTMSVFEQPGEGHRKKAAAALESMGLAKMENSDYNTLSEGQRQLVILARAIVQNSPLMLFDEPDSALDFTNRHMVFSKITKLLSKKGKSAVISMHDANFALRYCDHLLLMKDGRLEQSINPRLCEKHELEQALASIYGNIELIEHRGAYIMIEKA